ncbi:hypothetical protein BT96DRAFT_943195 [Gymnopus androsaceus JB14]|uniref:Uncharacterized protein n=1 Tax=Gymnopus androsaceus JB14 TaxID=1447944 RepID=A0A6A4HAM6_9AGAR|nr:hypothetical protein BT96DRAFT_943195 [Gymnopus androsaceus JB14]
MKSMGLQEVAAASAADKGGRGRRASVLSYLDSDGGCPTGGGMRWKRMRLSSRASVTNVFLFTYYPTPPECCPNCMPNVHRVIAEVHLVVPWSKDLILHERYDGGFTGGYMACLRQEETFLVGIFQSLDQKFPPLPLKAASAPSKPLDSLVDGYGSESEESEEEADDPHVHFARTVSRAVLKRWFSTRMTKDSQHGQKPFRQVPCPAQHAKWLPPAGYRLQEILHEILRFGPGDAKNVDEGGMDVDREVNEDATDVGKGKEAGASSEKTGDEEGATVGDGDGGSPADPEGSDKEEDEEDDEDGDEEDNAKNFALSRHVTIAKELFAKKSPEAQAAIQMEAQEYHDSRQSAYEQALSGEDCTFAQLLADSYGAMIKGIVSISVVGLDEPDAPGEEPGLFLHQREHQPTFQQLSSARAAQDMLNDPGMLLFNDSNAPMDKSKLPAEGEKKGKEKEKLKKNGKGKKRSRDSESEASDEEEAPKAASNSRRHSSRLKITKPAAVLEEMDEALNGMEDPDFCMANILAGPDASATGSSSDASGSAPTPATPAESTPMPDAPAASEPAPATAAESTLAPVAPVASESTPAAKAMELTPMPAAATVMAMELTPMPAVLAPAASEPVHARAAESTPAPMTPVASRPTPAATAVELTPTPAAPVAPAADPASTDADHAGVTTTPEGGPNRLPATARLHPGSTAKPANLPPRPKPKPKHPAAATPKFPDSGPEFYDHYRKYLLSEMQDEPLWVQAVDAWYSFEKSRGFPAKGKGRDLIATDERPSAVTAWDPLEMEDGAVHRKSLLDWWDALQPEWHKQGEKYDGANGHDWGSLKADGQNGLLPVLACMLWWRKVEKRIKIFCKILSGLNIWYQTPVWVLLRVSPNIWQILSDMFWYFTKYLANEAVRDHRRPNN